MADHVPPVTPSPAAISFDGDRVTTFLRMLERLASGQVDLRLPVSPRHDELDAIAHGINALVGELQWAHARASEAQNARAAELQAAVADAQARSDALLRAMPDLMFVMGRDGTYLDYHARGERLFAPPGAFLGRTVREILPPPLAGVMMDAIERAFSSDAPVVVEYEMLMDEPRFYEARIVRVDADRLLSIVRDVTESKRASAINRDLARRLISRQEDEWRQIARELHDDISQRLAVTVMEVESAAAQPAEALQALLGQLSAQISGIATDVHDLSYQLHPSRLRYVGLVSALDTLCEEVSSRRGLQVAFSHGRIPAQVDPAVSLCLFRIVQEALHNVATHSGARSARVSLLGLEGEISLEITDSGVGFDLARWQHAGLGLVSMRERVAIVNGQLAIDSAPGGGTRVTVRIPFEPASAVQIT